jgi:hypothetical protein
MASNCRALAIGPASPRERILSRLVIAENELDVMQVRPWEPAPGETALA